MCTGFCRDVFSFLFHIHLWVELLGYTIVLCLVFWGAAKLSQSGCTILHSHQQRMSIPVSPHAHQHLLLIFLNIVIIADEKWHLTVSVFLVCCSRIPQTGWLINSKIYFSHFWKLGSWHRHSVFTESFLLHRNLSFALFSMVEGVRELCESF